VPPPLFASLRITRTATRDELAALDRTVGGVPRSYRTFAETYGAGRTNGLLLIFMPFRCPSGTFDDRGTGLAETLDDFVTRWIDDGGRPGDLDCLEPYDTESVGVAARYKELVFFATSENGESFCWLRTGDRFTFYTLDRAFLSLRYGGDDLLGMIGDLQTSKVKRLLGTGYEPLPSSFVGLD
jgi:hypothetical protein